MLIGFPPIFVADTEIIYGYNFVAPLTNLLQYFVSMFFRKRSLKV